LRSTFRYMAAAANFTMEWSLLGVLVIAI
jgi:hypothetical protein